MRTTIDASGRLVIPREIRDEADLRPGAPLEITVRDGRIEIEPRPRKVRIIRKGRLTIAVPVEEAEPLTADTVRQTRDAVRSRSATE